MTLQSTHWLSKNVGKDHNGEHTKDENMISRLCNPNASFARSSPRVVEDAG
jgi:hypothetical protein